MAIFENNNECNLGKSILDENQTVEENIDLVFIAPAIQRHASSCTFPNSLTTDKIVEAS